MGTALEIVTGTLSAAAVTTPQALAANSPGTFTVRSTPSTVAAQLLTASADLSGSGQFRIRSPRMHDSQQSLAIRTPGTYTGALLKGGVMQPLYSQDTLTVDAAFDAAPVAATIESASFTAFYPDLPGVNARLMHWADIAARIESYYIQEALPATAGVGGTWGPGVVLNSAYDDFKANRDYALIGYTTSDTFTAFAVSGSDTGNLYVGGPGYPVPQDTRSYFKELSDVSGYPTIPVINAANKLSTQVYACGNALSATVHVGLIFALLTA